MSACSCGNVSAIISQSNQKQTDEICVCTRKALEDVILGNRLVNRVYRWMIPDVNPSSGTPTGAEFKQIPRSESVKGLFDYFEDVFWPRLIELARKDKQSDQQFQAVTSQIAPRIADAQMQVAHMQRTRELNVTHAANSLGREDVLCPAASRLQSFIAADIIVNERVRLAQANASKENSGAANSDYATGPVDEAVKRMRKRIEMQYCEPSGNAGVDSRWCPGGAARVGWDTSPKTLTGTPLLQDGSAQQNSIEIARDYIKNIFGPLKAIPPLRADKVADGPPKGAIAELLAKRASLDAVVQTFEEPFLVALEERRKIEGAQNTVPLSAVLIRAGITDANQAGGIMQKYIANAPSKLSMEEIHYKLANTDPKRLAEDVAKYVSLNEANAQTMIVANTIDMVVLLYDLREQMKANNRLIGALGSLLVDDRVKQAQGLSRISNASID